MNKVRQYAPRHVYAYWSEFMAINLRDYQSALSRRSGPGHFVFEDSVEFYQQRGRIYRYLNDKQASRAYFDSARIICEERLKRHTDQALLHADLGIALAGVGDSARAIYHGEKATKLLPVSEDVLQGTRILEELAEICTMIRNADRAIELLDYLLGNPSWLHYRAVCEHPRWDPLRDHPRFQALLKKYEKEHGT
jgi:tetratricopeptide (TPR) repeat protein